LSLSGSVSRFVTLDAYSNLTDRPWTLGKPHEPHYSPIRKIGAEMSIDGEGPLTPVAKLAIETAQINPPKPLGCGVFVDGKLVAVVELDELKRAAKRLQELENARK
jgi:hypothetical protein